MARTTGFGRSSARRARRGRRRRPSLLLALLGGATLLGLGVLWVAVTALMARAELDDVRAGVPHLRAQLTAADVAGATTSADSLARHARRAHHLTRGPAWAVASRLPLVGAPLRTARGITEAADELGTNALPHLVTAGSAIDPDHLRTPDGGIDLAALERATPALQQAADSIARAIRITEGLPAQSWLDSVDLARTDVLDQLRSIQHVADSAAQAAQLLPPMLGADGAKRYLLIFQNNAEARGTGGLPGAFALVRADRGVLSFDRFGSDTYLDGVTATVNLGKDYNQLYQGAATTTLFLNGNLSPHFPYAAQIWRSMWQRKAGQSVDGVVAVDPQALSHLLAVTGPAKLADGTEVSAANVVKLTQSTAYTRFPTTQDAQRRAFLTAIAQAVAGKIVGSHGDATGLARALAAAAHERRLLVWSAEPGLQAGLEATAVSGSVPQTGAPYVGMSVVNEGGNKLDYYLDRSLVWQRSGCGATRTVTVTATVTNNAPAGLPPYVTARSDDHTYPTKPGDQRISLAYAATQGALMESVTLDGKPAVASIGTERGHPVFTVDVELPRGKARTVVFHLQEPAAAGTPIVLRQPLVRPFTATVHDKAC
jgi:hypothetical protein